MKIAVKTLAAAVVLSFSFVTGAAFAVTPPVAGTIGVTVEDSKIIAKGWSVRNTILGMDVYNDVNEKVGTIEDIIVTPDKAVSYAIIGAGGFLGLAKRSVAIPIAQFTIKDNRIVLAGATKEAFKALPPFKYAD